MLNLPLATWPGQADSAFGRQNATNFPTFASMVKCVRSPTQAVAGGSIRIQPFSKARCGTKGTADHRRLKLGAAWRACTPACGQDGPRSTLSHQGDGAQPPHPRPGNVARAGVPTPRAYCHTRSRPPPGESATNWPHSAYGLLTLVPFVQHIVPPLVRLPPN
jgi:hypothetical protein